MSVGGDGKIAVVGSGAWGIALALMLDTMGYELSVWASNEDRAKSLAALRVHSQLEGVRIPDAISFTNCLESCVRGAFLVVIAVSSRYVRGVARELSKCEGLSEASIVCVSKGIENDTYLNMAQVADEELKWGLCGLRVPATVALLGPTHAEEVALGMPSAALAAHPDLQAATRVQQALSNPVLRVYTSTDREGAELCGATKNVIAIASGVLAGLGYGDNTRAALITRGMAEIRRLGVAMGASEQTFFGLAGIGDLIVTATSTHSRNFQAGVLLGQGLSAQEAVERVDGVVEGLNALPAILALASRHEVEMPITEGIDDIVSRGAGVQETITRLMERDLRPE